MKCNWILILCAVFFSFQAGAQLKLRSEQFVNPSSVASMPNGCNIVVNAGPDITICEGVGKQLNANVSGGFSSYTWDPPDGLSNPNVLNPVANPMSTTTYTLTARGMSGNKFLNGGFENGSIAPSTSSYTPYTNINNFVMSTGGYMVMSVPQIATAFGCNPNIGAFTMAITPTGPAVNILCQTVTVNPNTVYKIYFKVFGILYILGSPPSIGVKINGNLIGQVDALSGLCLENDGTFTWNSGASTSANICFANYGGTGMFSLCGLDDISFIECCEEKDEVTVTVYELMADIAQPDDIDCNNRPLTLDGSGSSSGAGITYEWTTTNGKIVSGDKTNKAVIDAPGTYKLKVLGPFGCTKEVSVTVGGSVKPPDLTLKATDIDCKNPKGSIDAKSRVPGVTFDWSGPNGYTYTRSTDFNITEPGDYEITITDDYGCKATGKVTVKDLRTDVDLSIDGDTIRCGQDSVLITGYSVSAKPSFEWTYPDGNKIAKQSIFVKDTGWHYLRVVDSTGCEKTDSFFVVNFKSSVPVDFLTDTINCANSVVNIQLKNTDTTGTLQWSGPNGFVSSQKQISVSDSGWYVLRLLTKEGCPGFDSVYVAMDKTIPDLGISNSDTLNCLKTSVQISATSNTAGARFDWLGPTGILGNNSSYAVTDSGDYILIVQAPNGCLNSAMVKIYQDLDTPKLILVNDTLNCIKLNHQLEVSTDDQLKYSWSGPNGYTSNLRNPVVNNPGEYIVVVTGKNGCPKTGAILLSEDKNLPALSLDADTINCFNNGIVPSVNADPQVTSFAWTGPNNFSSSQSAPLINRGGIYILKIIGKNGCENSDTVQVLEDLVKPTVAIAADTITCKTTANISIKSISANTSFIWIGPSGFTSTQAITPVTKEGWYFIEVTGPNGCKTVENVYVFQKDVLPDVFTKGDTLNCNKLQTNLQGGSSTQGVRYEWTGPNNFSSMQQNPVVQDSGIYILKVIDANGCEATSQLYLAKFGDLPDINLKLVDSLSCRNNQGVLLVSSTQNISSITWTGPNGFTSNVDSAKVREAGLYTVKITNAFGCERTDTIRVFDFRILPDAQLRNDTITCNRRMINLNLIALDNTLRFNWAGPNNFSSTDKNPVVSGGGTYQVTITNNLNCERVLNLSIGVDTLAPTVDLLADSITCLRSSAPVRAQINPQGFNIQWTGPNGFRSGVPQFAVTVPGLYTCVVTLSRNKCTTTKTVEVVEDTARIRSALIDRTDASCGLDNGRIVVTQINGGSPAYQYSFDNGKTFQANPDFNGLPQGIYMIKIKDRNGCTFDQTINIVTTSGVELDLIPEIQLQAGTQQTLNLIIKNSSNPKSIVWSPADQLSCSDCPNPILTANKDQEIKVVVTDENGCTDEAVIKIKVTTDVKVFVPSVFSPNGDLTNDVFYPVSNTGDVLVQRMLIMDRWGAAVFDHSNFKSDDPSQGWNGTFKDVKVNPGVYVYYLEVKNGDAILKYYGDITVVR